MAIVFSSIAAAIVAGSTRVLTGSTGTVRHSIPNRWQPLSNAGCAVSGFTMLGAVMPRRFAASSR